MLFVNRRVRKSTERGSSHGYDVSDHTRVNSELGGPDAHAAFCRALREAGLGQVLDIVPATVAELDPVQVLAGGM